MSDSTLKNPIFQDEAKAREWLEAQVWPHGPVCPHCGVLKSATKLNGEAHRDGVYQCNACREQFTVTVGTVIERSKVPLTKWVAAFYFLAASKKGMSTVQLSRMLRLSYQSTWFMMHRVREAMREGKFPSPLGGQNKVVEADETYVGGKETNKHKSKRRPGRQGGKGKEAVVALVEREGRVRSQHLPKVSAKTLKPMLHAQIDKKSYLMTDEAASYTKIGEAFSGHGAVNHGIEEYVRGNFWHTNTVENYFSILKRGITGVYHHVSQQHLKRYLAEFDFRYNEREGLGIGDMERTAKAVKGISGKRLTYRRIGGRPKAQA